MDDWLRLGAGLCKEPERGGSSRDRTGVHARGAVLKSWFGGAQKAERVGVTIYAGNTPPAYTSVALESQIRLFADLCFMLQDYDVALKHYRMVRDDYKNDGANKAQAGAMEMIGVCMLLLGGSAREIETSLENSIVIYQREGCTALATRATLLLYDCYKLWRRNFEASIKLLRASDHESANNCRAAIMLELGGYCFLQMSPPQFRKYAFHLVLAGFRYNLAHQRKHTVRYGPLLYRTAATTLSPPFSAVAEPNTQRKKWARNSRLNRLRAACATGIIS